MITGNLAKLRMTAYTDSQFQERVVDDTDELGRDYFLVQVNPENYIISYPVVYDIEEQPSGTSGYDRAWDKNPPRTIQFEFLLDSTGAIEASRPSLNNETSSRESVTEQIKFLKRTVFDTRSNTHVPNYLIINWGELVFKCRLTEMSINYKMFSVEGSLIRATVTASFQEVISDQDLAREQSLESPDITHVQTVKAGDTLPIMAKRIYGDERYYIAVAKANKLIQFRHLQPGQKIVFPPIEHI